MNRLYDIWILQSSTPLSANTTLQHTLALPGEGGRFVTGVQKLAQWVILELLRSRNRHPFFGDKGTDLLNDARRGLWRNPGDVVGSFARARNRILSSARILQVNDPADERLRDIELISLDFQKGHVAIRMRITTEAGASTEYLLPVPAQKEFS